MQMASARKRIPTERRDVGEQFPGNCLAVAAQDLSSDQAVHAAGDTQRPLVVRYDHPRAAKLPERIDDALHRDVVEVVGLPVQ